jgi:hypothetical protein
MPPVPRMGSLYVSEASAARLHKDDELPIFYLRDEPKTSRPAAGTVEKAGRDLDWLPPFLVVFGLVMVLRALGRSGRGPT